VSTKSSAPFSRDSIWNRKPAPTPYLHKQLDATDATRIAGAAEPFCARAASTERWESINPKSEYPLNRDEPAGSLSEGYIRLIWDRHANDRSFNDIEIELGAALTLPSGSALN
jgi:hypothetical protein